MHNIQCKRKIYQMTGLVSAEVNAPASRFVTLSACDETLAGVSENFRSSTWAEDKGNRLLVICAIW
jgi:hypothetical protein